MSETDQTRLAGKRSLVTTLINGGHIPDILDCISHLSSDEVFTPPAMVNKVLDSLPKEVWENKDLKWLEPATKTGIFLREIAKRLMVSLKADFPDEEERRQHIFQNMLHGMAITELTALMARRSLYTSKNANGDKSIAHFDSPDGNIAYENRDHTYNDNGNCIYCRLSKNEEKLGGRGDDQEKHAYLFIHLSAEEVKQMKFDVIVGNPPYQLNDGGGTGASAMPIYQKFVEQAKKLQPKYMSFIIPSRWFAGGKGLDEFRSRMLVDRHIKVIYDYPNASDCFPGVEIKGGVMYFVWDKDYTGDCEIHTIAGEEELPVMERPLNQFDVLIRYNQAVPILEKIRTRNEDTLNNIVLSRNPFGFKSSFSDYDQINNLDKIKIYAKDGKTGFVRRERAQINKSAIDSWKVLTGKAGSVNGQLPNKIVGTTLVAEPASVCTESYLVAGTFKTEGQAENYLGYIKTRLYRFLMSLKTPTQNISKECFSFIPNLPMDEVWTDEKLYARYGITPEEQAFIESMIKEMS